MKDVDNDEDNRDWAQKLLKCSQKPQVKSELPEKQNVQNNYSTGLVLYLEKMHFSTDKPFRKYAPNNLYFM